MSEWELAQFSHVAGALHLNVLVNGPLASKRGNTEQYSWFELGKVFERLTATKSAALKIPINSISRFGKLCAFPWSKITSVLCERIHAVEVWTTLRFINTTKSS